MDDTCLYCNGPSDGLGSEPPMCTRCRYRYEMQQMTPQTSLHGRDLFLLLAALAALGLLVYGGFPVGT